MVRPDEQHGSQKASARQRRRWNGSRLAIVALGRIGSAAAAPPALIALAVLTGVIAGFGAVGFRLLIGLFHNVAFLGRLSFDYDALLHTPAAAWGPAHWPWGAWIIGVPVVGAVIVAFLVKNFAPEAKGHGVPEVMDSLYYQGGVIRPVVAAVKALASSVSIGTGGAVGREGPIIQIGAAFGSTVGTVLPLQVWQRATLIACGAAGGIAATFNTPIGGVLFAIELLMPEISGRTLIPVTLASGSATFISRLFLGNEPAFAIPPLPTVGSDLSHFSAWVVYIVFGLLLGLWAMVFTRSIYAAEDLFDRIPGGYYVRHIIGMTALGVLIYVLMRLTGQYYVQGVGYSLVQDVLSHKMLTAPLLLLALMVLKLLATSLTLGSGGSGGVFSPSLFMGAAMGGAYAWVATRLFPGIGFDAVGMAVIGMAGLIGSTTGAVVTAIVMIFEMTRDYQVIIPLLITVSVAYGMRRVLMTGSIYDLKLRRRGHFIPNVLQTNLYLLHRARDAVSAPMLRVSAQPDIRRLRRVLTRRRVPHLMVVDQGRVKAVIPAVAVRGFTDAQALADAIAHHERMRYVVLSGQDLMFDVVGRLRDADCEVAVLTESGKLDSADEVRGILTMADIVHGTQLPLQLLESGNGTAGQRATYRSG